MIIEQTFTVNASRQRTAALLVDVPRMAGCIPGVENVEEVEPGRYHAVLGVRLGPIRAAFQGAMTLDASDAPARLTATGEGRDRATGTVAKVRFAADLVEGPNERTAVTAVTDLALRGKMAQFGTGVVRAAAGEIVEEFAARINASLAAEEAAASSAQPAATTTTRSAAAAHRTASPGLTRILVRSVWKAIKRRVRALVTRRPSEASAPRRAS